MPQPSDPAIDACRNFGVDIEEFLHEIPPRFVQQGAIYLAGSLPEGFGNSTSDLDVMIVSRLPLDGISYVVRKDLMLINMIRGQNRRIDLEYINTKTITDPISEINSLDIPVDFVAERIDERHELLIHRLLHAIPVFETDAFTALLAAAQTCNFQQYMVKRCIHKIDGAALDLEGMVDRGDPAETLLRLMDVVDYTVDAFRFSHGFTNPLTKWRVRSLKSIPHSVAAGDILEVYLRHRVFGLGLNRPEMSDVVKHVREVLYWSDLVLRRVYV